jgi:hypothetical protein
LKGFKLPAKGQKVTIDTHKALGEIESGNLGPESEAFKAFAVAIGNEAFRVERVSMHLSVEKTPKDKTPIIRVSFDAFAYSEVGAHGWNLFIHGEDFRLTPIGGNHEGGSGGSKRKVKP